jgi:hypothetical protein
VTTSTARSASGVHARRREPLDAAAADGVDVAGAACVAVDGEDRTAGQRRVGEERPEERPAAGADVEQRRGLKATEDPEHASHARQRRLRLELVQAQPARHRPPHQRGLVVAVDAAAARERRRQRDVVARSELVVVERREQTAVVCVVVRHSSVSSLRAPVAGSMP